MSVGKKMSSNLIHFYNRLTLTWRCLCSRHLCTSSHRACRLQRPLACLCYYQEAFTPRPTWLISHWIILSASQFCRARRLPPRHRITVYGWAGCERWWLRREKKHKKNSFNSRKAKKSKRFSVQKMKPGGSASPSGRGDNASMKRKKKLGLQVNRV